MEVFNAALAWAQTMESPEMSLTGMGESTLHEHFIKMMHMVRAALPKTFMLLSTNAIKISDEILQAIKDTGAALYLSTHRPERVGYTLARAKALGIPTQLNTKFVDSGFDWAGQVEWVQSAPTHECQYLAKGWATVLQNGDIVNCCMDAHGLYPMGNVMDEVKPTEIRPIPLCKKCHLSIPNPHAVGTIDL